MRHKWTSKSENLLKWNAAIYIKDKFSRMQKGISTRYHKEQLPNFDFLFWSFWKKESSLSD